MAKKTKTKPKHRKQTKPIRRGSKKIPNKRVKASKSGVYEVTYTIGLRDANGGQIEAQNTIVEKNGHAAAALTPITESKARRLLNRIKSALGIK